MFEGSHVAIVTPFKDGQVHYAKLEELIERQIAGGTAGIVPCGTTGESPTLSAEEHDQVVSFTVKKVRRRVKVIAGAGSNDTARAAKLHRHAADCGADAALVITPYYNKPTQAGLVEHFKKVAAAADLPIVLYNVPGRTGVNMLPETVAKLAEVKNIRAVKEASGNVGQTSQILDLCPIEVLSGEDGLVLPLMSIGARGVISVVANVAPRESAQLVTACLEGQYRQALEVHKKLFPLSESMFYETNPIPAKTALRLLGLDGGELRLPLVPMSAANEAKLKTALVRFGLLKA